MEAASAGRFVAGARSRANPDPENLPRWYDHLISHSVVWIGMTRSLADRVAGSRRTLAAIVLLAASATVLAAVPFGAHAEIKAPDTTDYASMFKEAYLGILDNERSIKEDKRKLEDASELTQPEISSIKERITGKTLENKALWEQAKEFERLNIESYKLDEKTQRLFDEAEETIKNDFLGANGVYDLFTESKYRKVVVFVDPKEFARSGYPHGIGALIDDIRKSVDVDVEVLAAEPILVHSRGCASTTSPCQPAKGGIQISHQGTDGDGSTLGFKARHPIHGYGFVIAGHEAVSVNNNIVQPNDGGAIGVVKAMGGSRCDCAFVKSTGGHTMNDEVWAPDAGTIYPIGVRNTSPTQKGTVLVFDGATKILKIGSVVSESSNIGRLRVLAEGGDSGSAVIQPQVNGKANIHGMVVSIRDLYTYYEPYSDIRSTLGLSW